MSGQDVPGATLDVVVLDFFLWEDELHDHVPRTGDRLKLTVECERTGVRWSSMFEVARLREKSGDGTGRARLKLDQVDEPETQPVE